MFYDKIAIIEVDSDIFIYASRVAVNISHVTVGTLEWYFSNLTLFWLDSVAYNIYNNYELKEHIIKHPRALSTDNLVKRLGYIEFTLNFYL